MNEKCLANSRSTSSPPSAEHSLQYHNYFSVPTKMKQTLILSTMAFLASCVTASPTPTVQDDAVVDPRSIEKRAAITDAADVGYATQNGGYAHTLAVLSLSLCSMTDTIFPEPLEGAEAPPPLCLLWPSSRLLPVPAARPSLSSAEPSRDPPRSRSPLTSPLSASPAPVRIKTVLAERKFL